MLPLPLSMVSGFEDALRARWASTCYATARESLAVSLGLCGLRWEEVSRVRFDDLDGIDGRLLVRSAKGGHRRVLPIGVTFCAALRLLASCHGRVLTSTLVFVSRRGRPLGYTQVARVLGRWTQRFFGRRYSFHCLRHTAACRVYQASRDVLLVQRFLGHRSLMWTAAYLRALEDPGFAGLPAFCGVDGKPALRVVRADDGGEIVSSSPVHARVSADSVSPAVAAFCDRRPAGESFTDMLRAWFEQVG